MIYLDNNSTTMLAVAAVRAMTPWLAERFGNPASQHQVGRRARQTIEEARDEVGRILGTRRSGMQADRVIFTSGGTEANNLALLGLAGCLEREREPDEIVISAIEHPSISAPAARLEQLGWKVHRLPVGRSGVVRVELLERRLTPRTKLVSIMLANNETGVLQPVPEIAALCHRHGVPMHTDAVQMAGKLPVDFEALGVSAMTIAAHKFHGPLGIGALIVRHGLKLSPLLVGGVQQEGMRGGTESVALAVGMHAALADWEAEHETRGQRVQGLRDHFEERLQAVCSGEIVIVGADSPRLPNTSCVSFLGCDRQALVMALDLAGVACSTGSACASGSSEPSPVLLAMGCEPEIVAGALRFSLSATTSTSEIDDAVARIAQAGDEVRAAGRTRRPNART
jgi:cysteine desulfurase